MPNPFQFETNYQRLFWVGLFLLFITSSQPVAACDCAKISGVKANMHTVQTMLETFWVDHRYYPASVRELEFDARNSSNPYWKDFLNPSTSQSGYLKSFADDYHWTSYEPLLKEQYAEILGFRFLILNRDLSDNTKGLVVYKRINKQKYLLYATDKAGYLLRDKGKPFVLSNS
ncbi:MAG: hypothetical protein IV090_18960 [Candidatus Sericytochromatia bacterium]|nr:hypothetical protein [Candidatus Sericytochromatia bacterium]